MRLRVGDRSGKVVSTFILLVLVNLAAWAWAFIAFQHFPRMLETASLAYSFGLRHAVDADHIAAIDNVTRKLARDGKVPTTVGLFFSLGHSTIVVLACIAVAATTLHFEQDIHRLHNWGGLIGTVISASFLLVIAIINTVVLIGTYRTFRHVRSGGRYVEDDMNMLLASGGILPRIFRPRIRDDTAKLAYVSAGGAIRAGLRYGDRGAGLLGISAAEGSNGLPIWSILVFPALFTAGMSLVDTLDSMFMSVAYGWAFVKPIRKLYYNMSITAVSVIAALVVGGSEALGLIGGQFNLGSPFWKMVDAINENSAMLGYCIIGIFIVGWLVSLMIYYTNRYDEIGSSHNSNAP